MGVTADDDLSRQWSAVRVAVLAVVDQLPGGIADVTEDCEEESLEILPSRPGAPTVLLSNSTRNEILCDIAGTHFWICDEDDVTLANEVGRVVDNVVHHGFIQAGDQGRVPLDEGYIGVGAWTFTPWRWLRGKTVYPPFS